MHRRHFFKNGLGLGAAMAPWAIQAAVTSPETGGSASVREHGARGDGKTDDTAAFESAVKSGAGQVWLPRGDYRITRPIVIPLNETGNTSILGDGSARLLMDGAGPALHLVGTHEATADPSGMRDRVWNRERLPLVSGFEIRGERAEADGLRLEGTVQATVTAMLIRRCRHGIHLVKRNRNTIISHCHVYHNRETGIFFDRVNLHQANISDNHISYNPRAGILIVGGDMRNFQIAGNDIEYNHDEKREGSADVMVDNREEGTSFREGTIVGNTIQARPSPGGANIRMIGGEDFLTGGLMAITGNLLGSQVDVIHLDRCRGVSITGNSIYSATDRTLRAERSANLVFSGNTVDWNPHARGKIYYGSKVEYVDGIIVRDCDGVTISGSILENCFAGSEKAGGVIEIHDSRDVHVTDCQVIDARHRGLVLSNVKRGRVQGCSVIDRRGEKSTLIESVEVQGACEDLVIRGNTLQLPVKTSGATGTDPGLIADNHVLEKSS